MESKIVLDILSKGSITRREAVMVKNIFQELTEVRRYWDVEYFFHSAHQRFYLTAKLEKTQKPSLFIPDHVSNGKNFKQMKNLLALNSEQEYQGVYLAFNNTNSSCMFYQIKGGLMEPKKITSKNLVRNSKKLRETLVRKNRNLLEQSALYGVPVTLNLNERSQSGGSKDKES